MDHSAKNTSFWPPVDAAALLRRLEQPTGPIDVVLDTDTYNEVDDQFALSYLLKSEGLLRVRAICAAPFFNNKSNGPADGMEKSYREILTLLELLGRNDLKDRVYRGSERYLPSEQEPVESQAAEELVRLAMEHTPEAPLYIVAIGAITNVASALLKQPEIRDRIVIVWLGGNAFHWPQNREFNLIQDVAAARVIFNCGAAVVLLPCMGVVSAFTVSKADLETYLLGKNPLCDYLVNTVLEDMKYPNVSTTWSRVIWDVTAVAWLTETAVPGAPGSGAFLESMTAASPIAGYEGLWSFDGRRYPIRYVYAVHRDNLLADLVEQLTKQ